MTPLAMDISIGMNPDLFSIGSFALTWHGFLTFVAVVVAVYLVARWGRQEGIITDIVFSVAVWAIIGGIVGARAVHVIDRWDFYGSNPGQIFAIWSGGVAIYGAVLGGFVGGAIYAAWKNHPVGRLADITAPAMLLAMAIGRIGDLINGEHISTATSMPWGLIYTHPKTIAFYSSAGANSLVPTHPATTYEMLWDLAILGIIWTLRGRLRPDGMLFTLFLALYSIGRFFISFLRLDKEWFLGLNQAQLIAIVVLAVTVPLLVYRAQFVKERAPQPAPADAASQDSTES